MGRLIGTAPAWVGWPVVPVGLNLRTPSLVSTIVRRRWRALTAWSSSGLCRSACSVTQSSTHKKMTNHPARPQKTLNPQMRWMKTQHLPQIRTLIPNRPTQRANNESPQQQRRSVSIHDIPLLSKNNAEIFFHYLSSVYFYYRQFLFYSSFVNDQKWLFCFGLCGSWIDKVRKRAAQITDYYEFIWSNLNGWMKVLKILKSI